MSEFTAAELDRAYAFIMARMVEQGCAPHYTVLARTFGLDPEAGRRLLHALMATGIPCWLYPETDLIASFAPFNNQPTHYGITVDGARHGFAQCGFEAFTVTWLFPGRTVRVEGACLDCGEPVEVRMRDGEILALEPEEMVAYVDIPFPRWRDHPLGFT